MGNIGEPLRKEEWYPISNPLEEPAIEVQPVEKELPVESPEEVPA